MQAPRRGMLSYCPQARKAALHLCPKGPPAPRRCFAFPKNRHQKQTLLFFLENVDTRQKQHDNTSREIFEEMTTWLLEYEDVPKTCPASTVDSCDVVRQGCRAWGRIITSQGVFLATRQWYLCKTHAKRWAFPMETGKVVHTKALAGDVIGLCLVDRSFWPSGWRLFQETEDWCCIERDLRATTADRISWALLQRPDLRDLTPAAKVALHESLLQAPEIFSQRISIANFSHRTCIPASFSFHL